MSDGGWGGAASGDTSTLPTCSGDQYSWNAGYGVCTTYAPSAYGNHHYCNSDNSGGLYARDACPQCGQCSGPTVGLVQIGQEKHYAINRVWKQRKDVDREGIKAATMKKQKAANGDP